MTRFVIVGERSASPAATVRIAAINCSGESSPPAHMRSPPKASTSGRRSPVGLKTDSRPFAWRPPHRSPCSSESVQSPMSSAISRTSNMLRSRTSTSIRSRSATAHWAAPPSRRFPRARASGARRRPVPGNRRSHGRSKRARGPLWRLNADGSRSVSVDARVGTRIHYLGWITVGLLGIGVLILLGGASLIYLGMRRPRRAPSTS